MPFPTHSDDLIVPSVDRALPCNTVVGERPSKEMRLASYFTNCGLLHKCGLLCEEAEPGQGAPWNGKKGEKGGSGTGVEAVGRTCG